jgi:ATP-dependent RNA helicase RhlE
MLFKELPIIEPILKALEAEGYTHPTPIQQQAVPVAIEGRDLLGCAQTGTGKTAAFAIPILQRLHQDRPANGQRRPIRALILTPTRELAIQIDESFAAYGRFTGLRHIVIFGGVSQHAQTEALKRQPDILTATPGRLLDLIGQGFISLRELEVFVLDEADRMLDMGFIHDVKRIIAQLPKRRQTLFFSATMPPEIAKLADSILYEPVKVEVTPVATTAEKVSQEVYFVDKADKKHLLLHLLQDNSIRSVLIFTRTKHGANRVATDLAKAGIGAAAIHGNKSQNARQAALSDFKTGRIRALVATDIAARGIDIDELSHVINFELPNVPETYVHRIGRTGRAGASGMALSFCEAEEVPYLKDIQKLTRQIIPVMEDHPFVADFDTSKSVPTAPAPKQKPQPQRADRPFRSHGESRSTESRSSSNSRNGDNRRFSATPAREGTAEGPKSGHAFGNSRNNNNRRRKNGERARG